MPVAVRSKHAKPYTDFQTLARAKGSLAMIAYLLMSVYKSQRQKLSMTSKAAKGSAGHPNSIREMCATIRKGVTAPNIAYRMSCSNV